MTAKEASKAHAEVSVRIKYQDNSGTTRTFTGDPASLNWADVKVPYTVQWEDPDSGLLMRTVDMLNNITKIL